ncbi:hypothetical protein [Candidatus Accumulibacter sp. ACC003]|uniref:hypothetical protein n=1 Tax=Candidatus Accumulibacter sp. ACC003 TaxID=2823334 RepID=UPI0025C69CFC|nr:hypothetical protein [Candidatus Accumulibacter sp. ACC003]
MHGQWQAAALQADHRKCHLLESIRVVSYLATVFGRDHQGILRVVVQHVADGRHLLPGTPIDLRFSPQRKSDGKLLAVDFGLAAAAH